MTVKPEPKSLPPRGTVTQPSAQAPDEADRRQREPKKRESELIGWIDKILELSREWRPLAFAEKNLLKARPRLSAG